MLNLTMKKPSDSTKDYKPINNGNKSNGGSDQNKDRISPKAIPGLANGLAKITSELEKNKNSKMSDFNTIIYQANSKIPEQPNNNKEVEKRNHKKAADSGSQNKNILIIRKKTVKLGSGQTSSRKSGTPMEDSPKQPGRIKTPKKMQHLFNPILDANTSRRLASLSQMEQRPREDLKTMRNIRIQENCSDEAYHIDEIGPAIMNDISRIRFRNMNDLRTQLEVNMNSLNLLQE